MNPIKKLLMSKSSNLKDLNKIKNNGNYLIKKVAWGEFYKVDNDPYGDLWALSNDENGESYLVRTKYIDSVQDIEKVSSWSLVTSMDRDLITLSYKNFPMIEFSKESYGFDDDTIFVFKKAIFNLLEQNNEHFLKNAFEGYSNSKKSFVKQNYPELSKYMEE